MSQCERAVVADRATRLKVFQPIEIDSGAGPARAHLLNLSRSGALLHSAAAPDRGATLWVLFGDAPHRARIMWRDGRRFGVAFTFGVSAAQIDAVLAAQSRLMARAA